MNVEHTFVGVNDPYVILDTHIAAALEVALPKDERTTVNSPPLYIGSWMILSDQDMTALKHHVLSSAVMGTVFAGIIAWVAQPSVPFLMKALVLGGLLTCAQGLLVALSNVGILMFGYCWPRRHLLVTFIWKCCCKLGHLYIQAHMYNLDNGTTVWIDGMETVVISEDDAAC